MGEWREFGRGLPAVTNWHPPLSPTSAPTRGQELFSSPRGSPAEPDPPAFHYTSPSTPPPALTQGRWNVPHFAKRLHSPRRDHTLKNVPHCAKRLHSPRRDHTLYSYPTLLLAQCPFFTTLRCFRVTTSLPRSATLCTTCSPSAPHSVAHTCHPTLLHEHQHTGAVRRQGLTHCYIHMCRCRIPSHRGTPPLTQLTAPGIIYSSSSKNHHLAPSHPIAQCRAQATAFWNWPSSHSVF